METIIKWAITLAIVAGVVYAVVFGYELWRDAKVAEGDKQGANRVTLAWNKDVKARDDAHAESVRLARKAERDNADRVIQGERDARKKHDTQAAVELADAQRAAAVAGSLSSDIAALDAAARSLDLSSAAACPGQLVQQRDDAMRARKLFGACVAEYRDLAKGTDDAFRAITLKLDTALSYIATVAPR